MRLVPFIFSSLILLSCSSNKEKAGKQLQKEQIDSPKRMTQLDSAKYRDSNSFRLLHCGLYANNKGDIAVKTPDNTYVMDTTGVSQPFDVYVTTVWSTRQYDNIQVGKNDLKNAVDTNTFQILGSEYFKDKKRVYHFTPMADGGVITILSYSNPSKFKILENEMFALDNKYCYYRGVILKGADTKTFMMIKTPGGFHFAKDKNNYYDGIEIMTPREVDKYGLKAK